eukprot:11596865-Karenia_brevis.AAC.1
MEYFGFNERSGKGNIWINLRLKSLGGLSARLNFMSLDCPNLQFAIKQCNRDMANPKVVSWRALKKIA